MHPSYSIALTPLTPLHIGCNEDFQPTLYFIENGWLYYFDPTLAQALLPKHEQEALQRLLVHKNKPSAEQSCALQRFFYQHRALFKAGTQSVIPVSRSVETLYLQRVGVYKPREEPQQGRPQHPHRLVIERQTFDAGTLEPIIPGGLLTGALKTVALSAKHSKHPRRRHSPGQSPSAEQGKPDAGKPFSVRVQTAIGSKVARIISVCSNSLNKPSPAPVTRNPTANPAHSAHAAPAVQWTRREIILEGQYRQFRSELSLVLPDRSAEVDTPDADESTGTTFADLAKLANAYFRSRFNMELHHLEQQGYAGNAWLQGIKQLFNGALREAMDEGRVMLLRIGQHDHKGQLFPNAAWFAVHDDKTTLFPLGWVLVECDQAEPIPELVQWCQQRARSRPDSASLWASIKQERIEAEEKRAALEKVQRAAEERLKAQEAAEQLRQASLNALSPEQRKVEELAETMEKSPTQSNVGTALFQQVWGVLQEAVTWPSTEQKGCETRLAPLIKAKFPHWGKREKEIKACLRQLRGESV